MNYANLEEFLKFVSKEKNGCWRWTGSISPEGYGRYSKLYAHRISFSLHCGNPDNYDIHHNCGNKLCVNPDHLEKAYHGRHQWDKPNHCKYGHPLNTDNLDPSYLKKGVRRCLICRNEQLGYYNARRRR